MDKYNTESYMYGMNCLIQFEDFANVNAFRLLHKYRNQYLTFNDDIQGTAAVAVAGLLAALRITKNRMSDHTIVFQGAGEAAMGIAELIVMAMEKEGLPQDKCVRKIWMVDSKGLIVKGRDHLTPEKQRFAHEHTQMKSLEDVVKELKPTAIIEGTPCRMDKYNTESYMYGMNCLIQFEDFANVNAFRLLHKYRNQYLTFNDDIQGTAAVAVAGLLAALRITKNRMSDHTIVFQGAGEAAMGIAELIVMAMEKEGLPQDKCVRKIWMVDSKGLIVKGRDHLTPEKQRFAHEHTQMKSLEDVVKELKPTAIIGVAAIAGAFTESIIKNMAAFNERPIIFALSNPTSKAECTAEQCYTLTQGRGIFASGSPFAPVTLADGRTFFPGQGNNSYVFPGVALGAIACSMSHIPDQIFLITAETLAELVTEKDLAEGRLYPPLTCIQDVSFKIAVKTVEYAYKHQMAMLQPEPADKEALVRSLVYTTDYDDFTVDSYRWPEEAMNIQTCRL
ncbi:hypothetical protein PGIGA_G00122980 [Pangasianodon gigas]|uniref:Uncharacterized protein n=1 Tax=Pangasianodon gigas TaxID=30993 RepID=A0ACC5XH97_PANGG|nr:hypothetical protein [Pangasianodon gigas]